MTTKYQQTNQDRMDEHVNESHEKAGPKLKPADKPQSKGAVGALVTAIGNVKIKNNKVSDNSRDSPIPCDDSESQAGAIAALVKTTAFDLPPSEYQDAGVSSSDNSRASSFPSTPRDPLSRESSVPYESTEESSAKVEAKSSGRDHGVTAAVCATGIFSGIMTATIAGMYPDDQEDRPSDPKGQPQEKKEKKKLTRK